MFEDQIQCTPSSCNREGESFSRLPVQRSKYGIVNNTKIVNLSIVSLHNTGGSLPLNFSKVGSITLL